MKNLTIALLTLITGFYTACGANKTGSGSSDQSSHEVPVGPGGQPADIEDGLLAECSGFKGGRFSGASTTFYNQGSVMAQFIRFAFKTYPFEVPTKATHYIQFFRWGYDDQGAYFQNDTAVSIYVQLKSNGKYLNTTALNRITRANITDMITKNNLGSLGIKPENFLNNVILVMDGMDLKYDAITIALYDTSIGNNAVSTTGMLIPAFSANPNTYIKKHPYDDLVVLHPNYEERAQTYSDEAFRNLSFKDCEGLL